MNEARHLLVISGPSGAGKDTVVNVLRAKHPEIAISVSATTRAAREGEQHGVNYFYHSTQAFEDMIAQDALVEYTCYCGNYYGTPRSEVDKRIRNGVTVVLVIEVEGAANIKRRYPECTTVFVCPPSMDELEHRLRLRGTETEESIAKRMRRAAEEMKLAPTYDYSVVNNDVERCADSIYAILQERQV